MFALAKRLCTEQNPKSEIIAIKYFTADIKAKLSTRGDASWAAQQDYLQALKKHIPCIQIIKGSYAISKAKYHAYTDPIDFDTKHTVWRAEEKQTDVNIAIHMVIDAIDDKCEQAVLFSNDTDLVLALQTVRERKPNIIVGTIAPIRGEERQASVELSKHSHWTRHGIRVDELTSSQLPNTVLTRKRLVTKPDHW